MQVLNLFLALVVNSFSHEDTPVSRQGEKVLSRMLKAALSVSFSAVNIMKRAQVHPTSCDSLQEKEDKRTTGNFADAVIGPRYSGFSQLFPE